jgi:hypothetical protein
MKDETLTALKASIAHWQNNVDDPENSSINAKDCALCMRFIDGCTKKSSTGIEQCPVAIKSRCNGCCNTPYEYIERNKSDLSTEDFVTEAQKELDFLKSLLP